jgi:antitoxin CptB
VSDTKTAFAAEDLKRLYWHSRRGMLELDLLLVPFAERCLPQLDDDELQMYRELLAEEDQDLFVWLTRRAPAPTPRLQRIIEKVLQAGTQDRACP